MTVFNETLTFPNGKVVSTVGYPYPPVMWAYYTVDCVCAVVPRCSDWRSYLNVGQEDASWLNEKYKIPDLGRHLPVPLSYSDFRSPELRAAEGPLQQQPYVTVNAVYRYAFDTPTTKLAIFNNMTSFSMLIVLTYFLRRLKRIVMPYFRSIGHAAAHQTHGPEWVTQNSTRITKFAEYVFRLCYHSTISVYGVWYFCDKAWWRNFEFFSNYPYDEVLPGMAWYYLLQAAYNLDAFLSLMEISLECKLQPMKKARPKRSSKRRWQFPIRMQWAPTVRGDFQEMFVHHVVTNVLVIGSSYFRLTRIGSMVFLLHDISDVPVDLSKLANFVKWKLATIICFGIMAITWFITRLVILPFKVFAATLFEGHLTVQFLPLILFLCWRYFFYVFLLLLIVLHAAWFAMFVRMFVTLVTKNEVHDFSEHKNGERDSTGDTNNVDGKEKKDR